MQARKRKTSRDFPCTVIKATAICAGQEQAPGQEAKSIRRETYYSEKIPQIYKTTSVSRHKRQVRVDACIPFT